MHAAAINLRGGVSPRGTLLRGQGIIEYVLIIAIIGLVIVFAGPGVAGAIRNQFNLVGNTVNNGTSGSTEGGGASGGGSAGADSATVQAAVAKDAKDWTLDDQKAVAEDIAAKGEASPAYSKAKAALDAGTKFTVKLTNGKTLEYRIVGINHDDLADGSGKAGTPSATTDKVFLLSTTEVYGDKQSDGTQYEFYKSKGVTTSNYSGASSSHYHWTRSVRPDTSAYFRCVYSDGDWVYYSATGTNCVFPAWCF